MKLQHNRIMTDALREIRHTRSRFLSLLVLSALSVCFLAGLRATAPDMKNSADLYFDQQRLMDLRITSTLGLTEEDAAALERQEGVLAVERACTVDAMVHLTDDDYIVKALSFTESSGLNAPKLVEGRLPQTAGECLVEPLLLEETGLSLGDAIALDTGSGSYEDALALEKFTIVGTANSPLYIGVDRGTSSLGTGQVSAFVLLPLEAFTLETYTDFYLQVEGAQDLNSYSDAYTQWIDDFSDSLEPFADQRARMRGDEVIGEANEALADAEAELSDAQAEAEAELSDAWAQLEEGRADLDEGRAEYRDGVRELNDQVAQAEQEIADGQGELDEALSELNDGEQELTDARADLDEGWTEYYDGLAELEDARQTLAEETADAQLELSDALAQLQDGEAEYRDGLQEYREGEAEAQEQIADAQKELEQARRDIAEIEACQWYLLDRNTNAGYVSYSMDADRMGNLASVFPLIFFLVAALVCLTTMTRMVEEQRVTIGGLKALGYSKGAIAVKYVGYGFLASALGSLIGLAVGLTLLPWIICNAWNIIYTLGEVQYGLEPVTSSLACLAAVGTVTLSALGACFSTLTAVPAQLMRPKAPPAGKRVLLERLPFLWRRLSFNYKITIRNLFRYQRRFWMTVVGIGGCAALIVTAFGLRGSIFDIMDKQFDEIYGYTAQVGLVDQVTPGELREVTQALEESELVEDFLACSSQSVTAETDAYTVDATLQVFPSQEALEPFVHLRHRTSNQPVVLPDDGVVLTEKLASLLGVQAGDTITLDGDQRVEVRVADVTEHYIQHYVYMTDACYQAVFGTEPSQNLILADYPIDAPETEALERELVSLDGVTALTRMEDTRDTYGSSLESVDYAVVLIIVCAAALAFVVLYNLTNINITERMRELATLKVLGFYDRELSAYIYRENVVLTVFGVAMGMVMGKLLHQWLILTVEIDLLMFGRELSLGSYAYAVVLTVIFSLLVNLAAHRSLKKLDMVESLKTVE